MLDLADITRKSLREITAEDARESISDLLKAAGLECSDDMTKLITD